MDIRRVADRITHNIRTFGVVPTSRDLAYRATNKLVSLAVLRGMTVVLEDLKVPPAGPCAIRFATPDEVRAAAERPEWEPGLSMLVAEAAFGKGDECVGCFDGDRLVSVGWYARTPTAISETLRLCFDPSWVYMHRGYTLPDYRGHRLHAAGMSWALQTYTARGARGLISYVEANNLPSLRSCERMGYRIFGDVWYIGRPGHERTFASPGCRPYGFYLTANVTGAHA